MSVIDTTIKFPIHIMSNQWIGQGLGKLQFTALLGTQTDSGHLSHLPFEVGHLGHQHPPVGEEERQYGGTSRYRPMWKQHTSLQLIFQWTDLIPGTSFYKSQKCGLVLCPGENGNYFVINWPVSSSAHLFGIQLIFSPKNIHFFSERLSSISHVVCDSVLRVNI